METIKLEWTAEYIAARLKAMGYEGTQSQVELVAKQMRASLISHSYQEEILRKMVRDIGAVKLVSADRPRVATSTVPNASVTA